MEVAFFDTSALVKHYHIERGSSIVNELMENYVVAISELAILEMTSALNRRFLSGELTKRKLEWVLERFYSDLENYVVVTISSETISLATSFVLKHGLKTLDSLQLASALKIKDEVSVFVTFDEKLKNAAEKEGFTVLP
ncbi:type II toxin-antitoxin system VapC family toxin [Thermococcus indicus]|uniref:Type II toxin-antitoxin system VapC family toxin n=1 Tax=Thermococcus indicus TaxID=2586643 RepID=A0A4Y5SLC2_9EURY|nr:type II toxin-antitoxin system VapC family toxin [Thermococcus indicus]QDA31717.1 type II toxin-antitoxin system VapC family toxin [Thermococcus indicus]